MAETPTTLNSPPQVGFDQGFFGLVAKLDPADARRINLAIDQFTKDPDHPSLRLKPLQGRKDGMHSIRAAQHLRVLVHRQGSIFLFIEPGHRQDIYDRAKKIKLVVDPQREFAGIVRSNAESTDMGSEIQAPLAQPAKASRSIFDHWTDTELGDLCGFTPTEIERLATIVTREQLVDLIEDWDEDRFDLADRCLELTPEAWFEGVSERSETMTERFRIAVGAFGAASGLSRLYNPEELADILAAPIEDWMVFLHPDQQELVERRYNGPARVRGAAGTGKTVVALHRAAHLIGRWADEEPDHKPVLFTTYIKSLPPVLEALYKRLPGTADDPVEFVNLDRRAKSFCRDHGIHLTTEPRGIDAAFSSAHKRVVTAGSPIGRLGVTRQYLRDEITAVIKGRGILDLSLYVAMERTGRRTPFSNEHRLQVWDLKEAWDEAMVDRGTVDFVDVLLNARDLARAEPEATYRAAFVDEAQDLSLVGLQFIRALTTGASGEEQPDSLFFVGDGAQRIFSGGFTLKQAGLDVRGRTTVLRRNYRNTAEIRDAALAVAGDVVVEDMAEQFARADAGSETDRRGQPPLIVRCASPEAEIDQIVTMIAEMSRQDGVGYGDVAILVRSNIEAKRFIDACGQATIPVRSLQNYDGTTHDSVKVGTYFRAKGLEFKIVFTPGIDTSFPRPVSGPQPEQDEAASLEVAQLFVAMTRARDALCVTYAGDPSPLLAKSFDAFHVRDGESNLLIGMGR